MSGALRLLESVKSMWKDFLSNSKKMYMNKFFLDKPEYFNFLETNRKSIIIMSTFIE